LKPTRSALRRTEAIAGASWDDVPQKFTVGSRVTERSRGWPSSAHSSSWTGIEGLIHVSEMSWSKKVKKAADLLSRRDG